jgi:hypothetical protein
MRGSVRDQETHAARPSWPPESTCRGHSASKFLGEGANGEGASSVPSKHILCGKIDKRHGKLLLLTRR